MKRILAVASGGGHWVQLLRLRPAFDGCEVVYVSVQEDYRGQINGERYYRVTDATRWDRWRLVRMIAEVSFLVLRERPDIVISTGAAPGVVALRVAKWLGARTVWIDSIANVETMSLSGQKARTFCDLWLTQWPDLARPEGAQYKGTVF